MKSNDIKFKFEQWGISCYSGKVTPMDRIHSHCEIELNWVTNGFVKYQFSDIEVELTPGKLYIFNGVRPHQLTKSSQDATLNWLTIPSWHIFNWNLEDDFINHLASGHILVEENEKECIRDEVRFERWREDIIENDMDNLDVLLLEIKCRIKRLLIDSSYRIIEENLGNKTNITNTKKSTNLVTNMQGYILKNLTKKITVNDLAQFVGLNPSYATTLFRKEVGQTPVEFLIAKRIEYVTFLLITTNEPILNIAMDSGFGSSSRFYDAFTSLIKMPPLEYRKKHRNV